MTTYRLPGLILVQFSQNDVNHNRNSKFMKVFSCDINQLIGNVRCLATGLTTKHQQMRHKQLTVWHVEYTDVYGYMLDILPAVPIATCQQYVNILCILSINIWLKSGPDRVK